MSTIISVLPTSPQTGTTIDVPKILREIKDIEQKTEGILRRTSWPLIEMANKASKCAKLGAIVIGGKFLQLAQFYAGKDDQRAIDYLDEAIKNLRVFSHYSVDSGDANFNNWIEICNVHFLRIKLFLNDVEEKRRLIPEALEAVNQALEIDPGSRQPIFFKFVLLKLCEEAGGVPTEDPMIWFRRYLDSHPEQNGDEYLHYAQLYGGELARRGHLDDAKLWFESLSTRRQDAITFLYLGKVQSNMNKTALALESIEKAQHLAPDNVEIRIWYNSVKIHDRLNAFRQINRHPTQKEVEDWVNTCNEFCTLFAGGEELFRGTASTFMPMDALARHIYLTQLPQMANLLTYLQQYPFALSLYEHILSISEVYVALNFFDRSEVVKLHTAIGGLCLQMEKYEEAESHLLQAIQLDYANLPAYKNLVAVYSSQKDRVKLAKSWVDIKPLIDSVEEDHYEELSSVLFNLGTAFTMLATETVDLSLQQAKEFYNLSLKYDPDNIDSKIMLARVLIISGDWQNWEEARKLLTQDRAANQPFEVAPFIMFQLNYCLAGIHALFKDIAKAKAAAIEAGKTRVDPAQVQILQSYLDNFVNIDFDQFCRQITDSIRRVEFGCRIGKFINPKAITFEEANFIGFHGTIDIYSDEIKKGIVPCGGEKRQFDGKGFYITDDIDIASYFAIRKAREEQRGRPVLLKLYSTAMLVGQAVQPTFKVKGAVTRHYDFIRAPIDGYEAFDQFYVFENSLHKMRASEETAVTWSDEEFEAFLKKWTRSGC